MFRLAMGRPATEVDLSYWTPRVEHCRLIGAASRVWRYSERGMPDLLATVTRSLAKKERQATERPGDQD